MDDRSTPSSTSSTSTWTNGVRSASDAGSTDLRRDILDIRRTLGPTRDAVRRVVDVTARHGRRAHRSTTSCGRFFAEVYDKLLRASEALDFARDLLAAAREQHQARIAQEQNDVIKKLAVIASLLLLPDLHRRQLRAELRAHARARVAARLPLLLGADRARRRSRSWRSTAGAAGSRCLPPRRRYADRVPFYICPNCKNRSIDADGRQGLTAPAGGLRALRLRLPVRADGRLLPRTVGGTARLRPHRPHPRSRAWRVRADGLPRERADGEGARHGARSGRLRGGAKPGCTRARVGRPPSQREAHAALARRPREAGRRRLLPRLTTPTAACSSRSRPADADGRRRETARRARRGRGRRRRTPRRAAGARRRPGGRAR